jgi:thiamine transport system permease protein
LGEALVSSVLLATAAGVFACLLGTLAAASAALYPGVAWVKAATAGPLAVSSVVVGVGLLLALAVPLRSWDAGTWLLLVAAQTLVALPIVVRIISPVLQGIDARQLAAAATLGAAPRHVAARIIAPRVLPAMGAAAGIAFAVAVGEFGASVFLTRPDTPTLPTTILTVLSRPGPDAMATAAAGAVVLALVTASAMLAADLATKRRAS